MADQADRANETTQQDADREARRVEAAIEGATEMRAWSGTGRDPQDEVTVTGGSDRAVGGNPQGSRGAGRTSAGPSEPDQSPAAETGGPRGAGTSVSSTSGGWFDPDSTQPVNPDEWIKRETSMRPKKPLPKAEE